MPLDREIWFTVVVLLTLAGLLWGINNTRRVIEAPFLYATGMAVILCPQLYVIALHPEQVPDEAFWVHNVMVVLCTLALYAGYFIQPKRPKASSRSAHWLILDGRLFKLGLAAAAVGTLGYYKILTFENIQEWRGWPVYWITLAGLALPGISLMMIAHLQSPRSERLLSVLAFSVFPLTVILFAGRRQMSLVLPLVYLVPLLIYNRRLRIPRFLVVAAGALVFIVVYAFPYWRGEFKNRAYAKTIREQPLSEIVEKYAAGKVVSEVHDSMIVAGARYHFGNYQWGIDIYNSLIELYVPGSLIGRELKNSFRVGEVGYDWVQAAYGIPVASYTAKNGYVDVFSQFSFLGFLVMYWIGMGFRRIHESIVHRRDGRAIVFLCFFITIPASIAYGSIFLSFFVQLPSLVIMLVAFRWCLIKRTVGPGKLSESRVSMDRSRIPGERRRFLPRRHVTQE